GAITGYYLDANFSSHGFLRSPDGTLTTVDFPGGVGTAGASINLSGTITGYYFGAVSPFVIYGFVRSPDGVWTSFDAVGSADTEPVSINSAGEIAGTYLDANQVQHGFLRDPDGAITSFDVPDANGGTYVTGISPSGEITGYYDDNDEPPQPQRGFLRSPDGTYATF